MLLQQAEELESHQEHQHVLATGTGRSAVVQGRDPRRAEGPSSAMLRLLSGSSPVPFCCGAALSAEPGSCRLIPSKGLQWPCLAMEDNFAVHQVSFGRKGKLVLCLNCAHLSHECHHAGVGLQGRTSTTHLDEQGHPLGGSHWVQFSGDREPPLLPRAWQREGQGLGQAVPVTRQLSGVSKPKPQLQLPAPCLFCHFTQHSNIH